METQSAPAAEATEPQTAPAAEATASADSPTSSSTTSAPAQEAPTDTPEPAPEASPAGEPAPDARLQALLDEAEQRGYKRGFDDAARKSIEATTGVWHMPGATPSPHGATPGSDSYATGANVITCIRPSVWDM